MSPSPVRTLPLVPDFHRFGSRFTEFADCHRQWGLRPRPEVPFILQQCFGKYNPEMRETVNPVGPEITKKGCETARADRFTPHKNIISHKKFFTLPVQLRLRSRLRSHLRCSRPVSHRSSSRHPAGSDLRWRDTDNSTAG